MFVKLKNIALGWYLFLFGKRTQQANNRVDICNDCPFRKGYFCGVCWCEIHAKASIPEEQCPKNLWVDHLRSGSVY